MTFDRESCVLYKRELDKHLPEEASDIVMHVSSGETEYAPYRRDRDAEEKLLERFRDPKDPLKIIIVTSKLLTGFDAPILQTMYLDKPLRDHALLQAICRTNRPYGGQKTHGLIVDYLGVFDDVAQALKFDEKSVQKAVSNIGRAQSSAAVRGAEVPRKLRRRRPKPHRLRGTDRGTGLPADEREARRLRVRFQHSEPHLGGPVPRPGAVPAPDGLPVARAGLRVAQAIHRHGPPPVASTRCEDHRADPRERARRCRARRPRDAGTRRRPARGRTRGSGPEKKAKEIAVKLTGRLRKHAGNPKYKALAERLEDLKRRHEQGLLLSIDFLKELLNLAKDVVRTERETPVEEDIDRGKAALTELFEEARNGETPVMVRRIVDDIDEIVRAVRFDGWQATHAGEREVKQALRRTLFKYRLHQDADLFERAYGYIREYY